MADSTIKVRGSDAISNATHLRRNGYRVLRFWNNDVRENIEGVLNVIWDALETRKSPPPPTPPHRKRGEGRNDAMMSNPSPEGGGEKIVSNA
jgi:Protein of unknown function (DUF559)